jgi:IS1 family transposase/transposase-like protein
MSTEAKMNRIRGPPTVGKIDQGSSGASPILHIARIFPSDFFTLPLTNCDRSLYILFMLNDTKDEISVTCKACGVRCQSIGKHRNGLRRFRCPECRKSYTEPHRRTLDTMYVRQDRAILALQLLLEGNSLRSTQRITGMDVNTIMSLLLKAGERCQKLMYEKMRNLTPRYLECDEIWSYVGKKDRRVRKEDSPELGSQWIFVALDAETKLIPYFEIGKRTKETTLQFLNGLKWTLADHHFQITTDGYHFYRSIQSVFAGRVDFAQLVKLFGDYGQERGPEARYSPSGLTEVISKVVDGNPDPDHISTSFVERQNLTMRMQMRRLTRLTYAFSKSLKHLRAAVALHFAYYNFCRTHKTIRVTPAMEAGITDHVWTIAELIA